MTREKCHYLWNFFPIWRGYALRLEDLVGVIWNRSINKMYRLSPDALVGFSDMHNDRQPMSARRIKVFKKLAYQSAVPLFFALVYAYWDFESLSERTASTFVKSLGGAFFLIMWFVGQWFRAEKQIGDA